MNNNAVGLFSGSRFDVVNDISTGSPKVISLQSKLAETVENGVANNGDFLSILFFRFSWLVFALLLAVFGFFSSLVLGTPSAAVN